VWLEKLRFVYDNFDLHQQISFTLKGFVRASQKQHKQEKSEAMTHRLSADL
jgi:hypothetical protein